MFINKQNKTGLGSFLTELKNGNDNILELLKVKPASFQKVPYSGILENPSDVGTGVVNVQTKFGTTFFNIFDKMLIKDYDNGDRTYIFYCKSTKIKKLKTTINTFVDSVGDGITDTDRFVPITDEGTLIRYTLGDFDLKDMATVWLVQNVTILLQYRVYPEHEFSLFITSRKEKPRDRTSKSEGTILDLLNIDIIKLFLSEEDSNLSEPSSDGAAIINKYTYNLEQKELEIFDQVTIQQMGRNKDFSLERTTNVTFHCSEEVDYLDKIRTVEKLIKLYGKDNLSSHEIELHEIEMIENLKYWTGRNWSLNEKHQLWDMEDEEDKMIYHINIGYDSFDIGFNLCIVSFSGLLEYFKAD